MAKIEDLVFSITSKNNSKMAELLEEMTVEEVNSEFVGRSNGNEITGSALHAACFSDNTVALAALLALDDLDVNTRLHSYFPTTGYTWAGLHLSHNFRSYTPLMVAATLKHGGDSFAMLARDDRVELRKDARELSLEYREYRDNVEELCGMLDLEGVERSRLVEILDSARIWIGREVSCNAALPTRVQQDVANEFGNDLRGLLESGEMSDFEIICGGKVIRCHKLILQARSNVLRRMLANDMKESIENQMVIDDLDCEILEAALGFVYSGKVDVEDLEEHGMKLLEVADRFELRGLTRLCEEHLVTMIDNDNAVDTAIMADMFNGKELREASIQWIVEHKHRIVKSEGAQSLLIKSPKLLFDIFDAFSTTKL